MTKADELLRGCFAKADLQELMFILLERDAATPATIRFWIRERIALGLNQEGAVKLIEAENLARAIEAARSYKPRADLESQARRLLEAVLLFYQAPHWGPAEGTAFYNAVQSSESTTKALCNAIRAHLAGHRVTPGVHLEPPR